MRKSGVNFIVLALLTAVAMAVTGCATTQVPSRTAYESGAVGAGVGAVAGALLDDDNSWRGGVIGAGLGALLGGAVGEISNRAARQAAYSQQPVVYTNAPGTRRVVADSVGRRGNCHIVKEKFYEHGQLVRETQREVCD
jgi:uncharacterized membrane protein